LFALGASAGIGFAIPIDVVERVVPQVISRGRAPTPGTGMITGNEKSLPVKASQKAMALQLCLSETMSLGIRNKSTRAMATTCANAPVPA
jgi:S1-C subfamily serine protease